ncbi:dehydrogenase/reductase SDR family member 7-like [Phlebotomus argentipes]|uniref:dehydrogenase/reductase SDR family member 7-like n=1 Tax=Phlebotomus argentipes TaxID=94469 RepID=UPI00289346B8|nr:dehydrogenase/reductase SDR family member 7-like [Phlebotomus argentipes]
MGFFAFIGVVVVLYYLVNVILWCLLDSDIELFVRSLVGRRISSLSGNVVWITGASSGIGKHLAIELAKNGVKLVLSARRGAELESVKRECLTLSNGKLQPIDILVMQMDMLEISRHQQFFDHVLQHFGRLDILVNNAGRSQRANWEDITIKVDQDLFQLDVFSVVNLSRIAVRYFKGANLKGHIAVTSSTAGLIPVPNSASYTGAKHAVHGYFGALQTEHPDLDVTIFCPGPTFSEFLQEAFTDRDGMKYGQSVRPTDKRMTAERCGRLFAIALANKLHINWVGRFPISLLIYICLYFPNIRVLVVKYISLSGLKKLRDSN